MANYVKAKPAKCLYCELLSVCLCVSISTHKLAILWHVSLYWSTTCVLSVLDTEQNCVPIRCSLVQTMSKNVEIGATIWSLHSCSHSVLFKRHTKHEPKGYFTCSKSSWTGRNEVWQIELEEDSVLHTLSSHSTQCSHMLTYTLEAFDFIKHTYLNHTVQLARLLCASQSCLVRKTTAD